MVVLSKLKYRIINNSNYNIQKGPIQIRKVESFFFQLEVKGHVYLKEIGEIGCVGCVFSGYINILSTLNAVFLLFLIQNSYCVKQCLM